MNEKIVISVLTVAASAAVMVITFRTGAYYEGSVLVKSAGLLLQAVLAVIAYRRSWVPAFFVAAAFVVTLMGYGMYTAVAMKALSYANQGALSEARSRLQISFQEAAGTFPQEPDLEGLQVRIGHHRSSVDGFDTADLSACSLPLDGIDAASGPVTLEYSYTASMRGNSYTYKTENPAVTIFPGARVYYRISQASTGLSRSGEFVAPVPEGLELDTGRLLYYPATGALFINCTHLDKYKERPWFNY